MDKYNYSVIELILIICNAAHALAHPSNGLARLRRVQIFKLFSYAESDIEYKLSKIEGHIKKEDTFFREALSSTERLAVCLR